ncbi:hypothetical protein [Vibrio cyclitrophicus]|uniref:hypothetical protein n=1 Tax=Vibrio cyclitrophicus TaxID=47951 RepID=UPI0002E0C4BB|nr:hypothetical protein [Vibrio cyclitrophicus]OEE29849.1 hypothetical protein OAM_00230 [Vibrio cyclitrophicus ZF14]
MLDLNDILEESFEKDISDIICEEHHKSPKMIYDSETSEVQISGCCDKIIDKALKAIGAD